jgi:predicted phosphohydrolase
MKLVWASDVHLNFLKEESRIAFYQSIKGDALVLSGDIAESHNVVKMIGEAEKHTSLPIYFVLGNHDFYGSSAAAVKSSVRPLGWLPKNNGVRLSPSTILLGVDGWGDCRSGDFENSRLVMNDWIYIEELRKGYSKGMNRLKKALQVLADRDARALKTKVNNAIKKGYTKVIIVTHVPPFEEVSLYAGRKSTPSGLPFFVSKILGESILPIAKAQPKIDFLWLSGHTHSRAKYKPCNNMTVKVAKAEYCSPQVEEIINVE